MNVIASLSKKLSQKTGIMLVLLLLITATISVYWQTNTFDFVFFDDDDYVSENPHVRQGFSIDSVAWAFTPSKSDRGYYHPLTWLSHMLDCQMFGLNPGAHHWVNLLLHTVNVILLFLTFNFMTGSPWKSMLIAALFALHPINVDSVAWISERKNLLSTMFWMLTMLAYAHYARRPSLYRYFLVFAGMAAGLLAKPMLVTLPCVLLLLDFWPLGRISLGQLTPRQLSDSDSVFQQAGIKNLVVEKLPLLALSFLSVGLSILTIPAANQMTESAASMNLRIQNAIVSYMAYLWKMIWPVKLAVFYPFPEAIPLWQPLFATFLIAAVTILIFIRARKFPYLAVGWLWYLGTFLPVIGIIQGGLWPALADRWAYIPFIGIFIIIAWGAPELIPHHHFKQKGLAITAVSIVCVLWALSWQQTSHWKNSQSLFKHALTVTSDNYIAHNNLGKVSILQNNIEKGIYHFKQAIEIKPDYPIAIVNLADVFKELGQADTAMQYYLQALKIQPYFPKVHNNLAGILMDQGQELEAILHYQKALMIDPDYAPAHYNLANALKNQGHNREAINHYLKAIRIKPDDYKAYYNLGTVYFTNGNISGAVECFKGALRLNPNAMNIQAALDKAKEKQ